MLPRHPYKFIQKNAALRRFFIIGRLPGNTLFIGRLNESRISGSALHSSAELLSEVRENLLFLTRDLHLSQPELLRGILLRKLAEIS